MSGPRLPPLKTLSCPPCRCTQTAPAAAAAAVHRCPSALGPRMGGSRPLSSGGGRVYGQRVNARRMASGTGDDSARLPAGEADAGAQRIGNRLDRRPVFLDVL